ncbi:MAG TPA: hypothetical protein VF083_11155 [Acidimicrobiia bacterium]
MDGPEPDSTRISAGSGSESTGPSRRPTKLAPLLILLIGAGCVVVMALNGAAGDGIVLGLSAAVFTLVGVLILYRTDGNRIGWVMAAIGLSLFVSGVAALADEESAIALAVGGAVWLSWFVLLGLLVYWFPTGRPVTPRWRFLGWLAVPMALISASYVVAETLCVEPADGGDCEVWLDNPIGITGVPNPEYGDFSTVGYMVLIVFIVLSAASLVVRFIRSRGVERLQLKWFAFAVVSLIVATLAQETLADLTPIPLLAWDLLWGMAVLALPVAIGLSVLRYRLYEIDRIVSRTVTYLLVVGLLGLVFFGVVTLITSFLPAESDLAVAASTLAVAALFNPVRRRVQVWIDRRFNRARYDAQKVMDAFADSLRDRVDAAELSDGWRDVVSETMQPSAAAVWIRP